MTRQMNIFLSSIVRIAGAVIVAASLLVLGPTTAIAQTKAVSPTTDPTNGYPLWYQDASTPGIRLQGCLNAKDTNCILLADPGFNPANPLVFPTNFPVEFFYFVADSDKLTTPGCPASGIAAGIAKWRGAVEGSFLTGVAQPGQQSTFARTKIVASGLCPSTTYTFTTPYGADLVTTNSAGQVVANKKGATIDIGCLAAPCDFTLALPSRVLGGFLRFDPAATAPPPGYLGDAVTLSPILGSPTNTNLFSITDGGGTVLASTNLFTVSGKMAGPLMASPTAIDFGGQPQGSSSAALTLTITNVNSAAITASGMSFTGTNAADFAVSNDLCTGVALAQDQSCTVALIFTPSTTAAESAQLNVAHNGPFGSPLLVNLSGTGTVAGSAPVVSLSTGSLAFGSQRVRTTSAAQTVTITNTGNAPLGATASIVNADPNLFTAAADQFTKFTDTCSGQFIPAGGTCSVSVQFAPTVSTTPKSDTALLSFTDNAAGSPHSVVLTGTGTGGIAAVSPTLDQYGYPNWYQDENGLQTQPCLDLADPTCVLLPDPGFNPANPLVFPTNFPVEFFYFVADSEKLNTPGCPASGIAAGTVTYRAALEGSFVNGVAIAGDQITFTRTKIVVKGLCPNTTYAFTHPYGTDLVTTDSAGGVVANKKGATIDVGCLGAPCNFSDALSSRVFGGILKWDPAVAPSAPAGHLGDGAVGTLHSIVGSPYNDAVSGTPANFFRIADPITGAVIAQTNLFTVSGKLATPISFSPGPIAFGQQNVGTVSATKTVTLTNIDVNPVNIATVNVLAIQGGAQSADFTLGANTCIGALAANATCTIDVSFNPTVTGSLVGLIAITHDGLNNPVEVPLSGTGVAPAPAVSLSSASLLFGNQQLNVASASQTVTVTNAGGANLLVSGVTLTGSNPGDFAIASNTCASPVAPAGSCVIGITFTPTALGARSALLNIADNAAGSPHSVLLSGTGVGNITTTSINAAAVTFPANGSVTVTVTSASGTPTGSVSLSVDGGAAVTQALVSGSSTFTVAGPSAGNHTLSASYAAQGNFAASSNTGTLVVNRASTSTTMTAPTVTSPANGVVTVTVTSGAGTPTGSVSLSVDGGAGIVQALVGGSTTFTLTSPAAGSHSLVANYAAQGNFAASGVIGTLVVNPAVNGETLVVSTATATAKVKGRTTTYNWSVSGTSSRLTANTITVKLTRTNQVIGTAKVSNKGAWTLSVTGSAITPIAGDTITATSSFATSVQKAVTIR